MSKPTFSVVIPLYNKEEYIVHCIESVLAQTFQDFEIVVVDDGSRDLSVSKLQPYLAERCRLIQKENGGVSSARNKGIQQAHGRFIAFLDADDFYEPTFLEEIARLFKKFPSADAAMSAFYRVHGQRKLPSDVLLQSEGGILVTDFYRHWSKGAFFQTSSVVIKKDYFETHDKWFPEQESLGEDQEMWFHVAEHGTIAYVGKYLINYDVQVGNSLTKKSPFLGELPFITRLRARSVGPLETGKNIFLQRYDVERAIINAAAGAKSVAWHLAKPYWGTPRFLKLKLLLTGLLILPNSFIQRLKRARAR